MRQMAATASAVLGQGKQADKLSRGLMIASLSGLVALGVLPGHPFVPAMILIGLAALTGLVELWFAARVSTDAALFHHLSVATPVPDLALLDAALTELQLLPAAKAGRLIAPRIARAFRMLRLQLAALIVQVAFIVGAAIAGVAR